MTTVPRLRRCELIMDDDFCSFCQKSPRVIHFLPVYSKVLGFVHCKDCKKIAEETKKQFYMTAEQVASCLGIDSIEKSLKSGWRLAIGDEIGLCGSYFSATRRDLSSDFNVCLIKQENDELITTVCPLSNLKE